MKIAIMGAGALGCYFGGRLAIAGQDVAFVARGAHLQALRESGMKVESPLGDFAMEKVNATSDPAEIGPVDLVVFLVKLYDTEEAAEAMRPLLKPETAVVSFQNGIDAWQRIGALVGTERVIGGLALIPAHIAEPGLVRHTSPFAKLTFGEFDGTESDRCKALLEALQGAGVDAELADNIQVRIWEKLVMLSALSAITTLTRLPMGLIRQDPLCGDLFREAIRETHAVGKAMCPALGDDVADRQWAFARSMPPDVRASMLDDLERGKRLELNDLSGAVVRLGREAGVPTPVHAFVQQALQPYVNGRPGD